MTETAIDDERDYTVAEALPLLGMGRSKFQQVSSGPEPSLQVVRHPSPTGRRRPIRVKGSEIRRYLAQYGRLR